MCGRVYTAFELAQLDMSLFGHEPISLRGIEPNYNQAPTEGITTLYFNQAKDQFEVTQAMWKLVPPYIKDPVQFKFATFNARGEDIFEKSSYKKPILLSRCEILVTGFIEWHYFGKTEKQPYAIHDQKDVVTKLAGIYTINNDKLTVSIVTIQANKLMANIHNIGDINPQKGSRMPLKLNDQDRLHWHNPSINTKEALKPIIDQYHKNDQVKWEAYKVDKSIGNSRNKNIELLKPIDHEVFKN